MPGDARTIPSLLEQLAQHDVERREAIERAGMLEHQALEQKRSEVAPSVDGLADTGSTTAATTS